MSIRVMSEGSYREIINVTLLRSAIVFAPRLPQTAATVKTRPGKSRTRRSHRPVPFDRALVGHARLAQWVPGLQSDSISSYYLIFCLRSRTRAAAVLVDELDAGHLKEHCNSLRPRAKPVSAHGSLTADSFRSSRRFGRCGGFCGARGGDPGKADARLIANVGLRKN